MKHNWHRWGRWRRDIYCSECLPLRLWHRWVWNDQQLGRAEGLPRDDLDYTLHDNELATSMMVLWWKGRDVGRHLRLRLPGQRRKRDRELQEFIAFTQRLFGSRSSSRRGPDE